jgi:hypothetical protein
MLSSIQIGGPGRTRKTVCPQNLLSAAATCRLNDSMSEAQKRPENLWLNLICNLALPSLILIKFSTERWLGPLYGLLVALMFPLAYGIWDFASRRETNFFSIIGFASVLLSGGLGVLKVAGVWFAVKDAAIPLVLGIAVLASLRSKRPLVRTVLLNDQIIDVEAVEKALDARQQRPAFDRLLVNASYWLAGSFVVVAGLHFALVFSILKSPPNTPAFNSELGRVHLLTLLVVALPSTAILMVVLWRVINGIERLTGLGSEGIFKAEKKT